MRHKYDTRGIVLSRLPLGETSVLLTFLTPDLGLVRARAQGLRASGAKLSPALATFVESEIVLIRGKEQWRVAGALLEENWFTRIGRAASRERAARVANLLLRLAASDSHEPSLFPLIREFFTALADLPEDLHEAAEVLAALRVLAALGLDAGEIPGAAFAPEALAEVQGARTRYIARINHGITASGL